MADNCIHALHNVYTPRGAPVRDAKAWSSFIDESLVLFGDRLRLEEGASQCAIRPLRGRLCARQCAREMRGGPSQPACGGRLQTTLSCGGQEPLVVSVKEKARLDLVRCETERRTQVNH